MLELLAAGAALAGRALLQAADTALLAVGEDELRALERDHPHRVRWLLKLKKEPETTAAALRGASSALLAFAAVACAIVVGDILLRAGVHSSSRSTLQLLAGLLAGAVALVIDLAPRSLALARPMGWALALAGPTYLVCMPLRGPVRLLLRIFDALLLRRGATARYTPPRLPLQEIEKMLSEEARGGGTGAPSPELVHGLFSFAERTAKEIMVPRTRVVGVPLEARPQEVIDLLAEEGHTRMPVYDGDLDDIVGEIHDEHDKEGPAPQFGPDGTALVRAEVRVDDLNESLGAKLPNQGDFETLGGLLNSAAGAIPQTGDRFYIGGLELTVVQRDERRVRLVRVSRSKSAPPVSRASGKQPSMTSS